jgi:archaellum biogenesis ATPase FlaH
MHEHNITPDNVNNAEHNEDTNFKAIKPRFELEKYSIGLDQIQDETERLIEASNEATDNKGLFTVKEAKRWLEQAATRPIPNMLFGEFWFEGELCILYASSGLGKSILAVQIGNSISRGEPICGFKLETTKQLILYFDFELSDKQFENRYSLNYSQHYDFDENFKRVEINPEAVIPDNQTFEDFLNHSLERSVTETGAKVLIIDNLTYLKNQTEQAKDALPLMKHLKALKSKYGLSILALAHTPKRDLSKPLTQNDLQGSTMLMNFCDSSFAIGSSCIDKNIRYLKQIKQRNTEQLYGADNVCVCELSKPENFVNFEFIKFGIEAEHLKQHTERDTEQQSQRVIELKQQGRSFREIGAELGISHQTAKRIFDKNNSL